MAFTEADIRECYAILVTISFEDLALISGPTIISMFPTRRSSFRAMPNLPSDMAWAHRPLNITGEAFQALQKAETSTTKPISTYQVRHRSNRTTDNSNEIAGLTFIVYPNGVDRGGLFFTFYLEPMRRTTMPLASIP